LVRSPEVPFLCGQKASRAQRAQHITWTHSILGLGIIIPGDNQCGPQTLAYGFFS
jgi:hypothetical protein